MEQENEGGCQSDDGGMIVCNQQVRQHGQTLTLTYILYIYYIDRPTHTHASAYPMPGFLLYVHCMSEHSV